MFKKFLSVFLVMVIVLNASAFAKPHWHQVGDKWRYLHERDEDDYFFSEWKKIEGAKYYFDDEGFMVTGYQEIDGEYYLFGEDGKYIKDITEYEYMNHMANLTAETGYNPLGEKYLEIHDDYKDYIESVNASKEYESESKAEAEEERLWLLEEEREKKEEQAEMTRELPTYESQKNSGIGNVQSANVDTEYYKDGLTKDKRKAVMEKVKQFKNEYIKDGMSDFEKEMMIVQYLVTYNTYDLPALEKHNNGTGRWDDDCYTAYGALIKGTSVCSGYARAFHIMAKECGLEVQTVCSATHAWNKVRIDGKWYNVDTTWEDPVPTNLYKFGFLNNNWINLTDEEIRKKDTSGISHNEKKDANSFKACTSSDYGKDTIAFYLVSGIVEKNIENDKMIDYYLLTGKVNRECTRDDLLKACVDNYKYNEEYNHIITVIAHMCKDGLKYSDGSNLFKLNDKEKILNYIREQYNNKKELVLIELTELPSHNLPITMMMNILGIKNYKHLFDGSRNYIIFMKHEGDLESLKTQNNETTTVLQTTPPQTTIANTISPAETAKSNSSSKINYEEASGKKTKNKKSLDDEDVEEYEEDTDEDEIDSDDE